MEKAPSAALCKPILRYNYLVNTVCLVLFTYHDVLIAMLGP